MCIKMCIEENGRKFICEVMPGPFEATAEVYIREVIRPHWKFFKTEFFSFHKWFWLSDHETIEEGVYSVLEKKYKEENEAKEIQKKWKEFEEKA